MKPYGKSQLFSPSPSYEGEKQNCVGQIYRKNLTPPTKCRICRNIEIEMKLCYYKT